MTLKNSLNIQCLYYFATATLEATNVVTFPCFPCIPWTDEAYKIFVVEPGLSLQPFFVQGRHGSH